jgi:hypothetical protein
MNFLIFDYFTKESEHPIPNGFNMSMAEFDSYKLKSSAHLVNRSFFYPQITNAKNTVPIAVQTFLTDPEFFKEHGKVYYVVCLNKTTSYYNFLFMSGMNSWLNFLNPQVVERVKAGDIKLVLQIFIETVTVNELKEICKYTEEMLGSLDNFEIWTCFNAPRIKHLSDWWNNPYSSRVIDYAFWEKETVKNYSESAAEYTRDKQYVSLCRRFTRERLITHAYIVKNNLLDSGFNSIPAYDVVTNNTKDLKQSIRDVKNPSIFTDLITYADSYYSTRAQGMSLDDVLPLTTSDEAINNDTIFGFSGAQDLEQYYKRSYLSLIQEGDLSHDNYMVTEKTYRPILYKHMFLMIGPPYLLASLQDRGYKTFDTLWDESYDKIPDDDERIQMVLDTFHALVSSNKLPEIYRQAQHIVEHNYQNLKKRTHD